jgi:hypothetical protein
LLRGVEGHGAHPSAREMMLHCGRQRRKPSNLQTRGEAAIDDRGRRGP